VLTANRAVLHDAHPMIGSSDPSLDSCEMAPGQRQSLLQCPGGQKLETEKFLIEVEGPWKAPISISVQPASSSSSSSKTAVSSSMQKLLKSKFQKPKAFVPPPPGTQPSRLQNILGKRRRPLQPGELVQLHYGGMTDAVASGGNGNSAMGNGMLHGSSLPPGNPQWQHQQQSPPQEHHGRPIHSLMNHQQRHFSTSSNDDPSKFNTGAAMQSTLSNTSQMAGRHQSPAAPTTVSNFEQSGGNSWNQQTPSTASQPQQKESFFATNEFNASSFYGFEEDEQHENEYQGASHTLPSQTSEQVRSSDPLDSYGETTSAPSQNRSEQEKERQDVASRNPPPISNTNTTESSMNTKYTKEASLQLDDSDSDDDDDDGGDGPSSFRLGTSTSSSSKASSKLSSNEMMALFGMAPPSPATTFPNSIVNGESESGQGSGKENESNQAERHGTVLQNVDDKVATSEDTLGSSNTQHPNGFYLAPAETSSEESSDEESLNKTDS
jgi:hypothetical protein